MQMCREGGGGERREALGALRTQCWSQVQDQPGLRQRGGMKRSQSSCCPGRARPTRRARARLVSSPFLGLTPSLYKQLSRL